MPDFVDSVNELARRLRGAAVAATSRGEPLAVRRLEADAAAVEGLVEEVQRLRTLTRPIPSGYGDLSDLPPELIAQLSGAKTDELEDQIYAIVKASGAFIELDRLLIELYRRTGTIHQRRFLMNKAYRMAQRGLIHIVRGRKGVYSVHAQGEDGGDAEPEDDEAGGYMPGAKREQAAESFSADLDDEAPF